MAQSSAHRLQSERRSEVTLQHRQHLLWEVRTGPQLIWCGAGTQNSLSAVPAGAQTLHWRRDRQVLLHSEDTTDLIHSCSCHTICLAAVQHQVSPACV